VAIQFSESAQRSRADRNHAANRYICQAGKTLTTRGTVVNDNQTQNLRKLAKLIPPAQPIMT
ncbi:MAG TPA: hypothetical protein VFO41_04535, partial [Alphaproteobacteria bacterium]|nr:hypothetical protein [Alphaproteobacteria bacterium]